MAETTPVPRHHMTPLDLELAELQRQEEALARLPGWVQSTVRALGEAAQGFPSEEAKAIRRNTP